MASRLERANKQWRRRRVKINYFEFILQSSPAELDWIWLVPVVVIADCFNHRLHFCSQWSEWVLFNQVMPFLANVFKLLIWLIKPAGPSRPAQDWTCLTVWTGLDEKDGPICYLWVVQFKCFTPRHQKCWNRMFEKFRIGFVWTRLPFIWAQLLSFFICICSPLWFVFTKSDRNTSHHSSTLFVSSLEIAVMKWLKLAV